MAGSTYNFIKGLGGKPSQKALESEYKRIRRNLMSSVNRYAKKGIYVAFFKVPKTPKKITEASLRRLKQKQAEWKYITGRGGNGYNMPARVSQVEAGIRQQLRNIAEIENLRIKEEDFEEVNKENPIWKKAQEEGYSYDELPDMITNEAIEFYEMAQEAIMNAQSELARKSTTSRQRSYWKMVIWRGDFAMQGFDDIALSKYSTLYSFNLRESSTIETMKEKMQHFLYDSGQTKFDDYDAVVASMTTVPSGLSMEKKKQLADIQERLGLT